MTTTTTTTSAAPTTDIGSGKGRSLTAGFTDAVGDRQLMFDPTSATSFELLQIKKEFADAPEFEAALRARVEEIRQLQHPSLATIHGVERRADGVLMLVSKLTTGRRVSELTTKARGAAFALELIRLITPALAVLHKSGERIAHGALTADRIIVTRDGRLMVVEYALGSAIESLKLTRSKLNEIGLPVPGGDHIQLDARTDMAQLGFIALSLLLGRALEPADCPVGVPALLDEFVMSSGSPVLAAKLRGWLERAIQISPRSFASAKEASDALSELPDDMDVRMSEAVAALTPPTGLPSPVAKPAPARTSTPAPLKPASSTPSIAAVPDRAQREVPDFLSAQTSSASRGSGRSSWMTAALAVLAGVEGVAIGVLLYTRPAASASAIAPATQLTEAAIPHAAGVLPSPTPAIQSPSPTPAASVSPTPATPVKPDTAPSTTIAAAGAGVAAVAPAAAAGPRFGGITVTSPIELQVFKDGTLLGSTGGPIAVNEGPQALLFVNETLGFRTQQTVTVKSGQMTGVKIGVPNGRISINAVPWADVTIDGNPAGETPIANLALPIGTHEIVFRHPQLGEKKQTVVVKVDGLLRVTQTLDPGIQR